MNRRRWMALCFALGSLCFFIGPFPGYANLVGDSADAVTFFVGSICFLVSGAIAYRASQRHGWLPAREGVGWWQPAANLLGCIFFGISAIAGYVVPSTGSMLSQAACDWNTSLGAACFLACALDTLHTGEASKMPRLRRLHELEHALERDVGQVL